MLANQSCVRDVFSVYGAMRWLSVQARAAVTVTLTSAAVQSQTVAAISYSRGASVLPSLNCRTSRISDARCARRAVRTRKPVTQVPTAPANETSTSRPMRTKKPYRRVRVERSCSRRTSGYALPGRHCRATHRGCTKRKHSLHGKSDASRQQRQDRINRPSMKDVSRRAGRGGCQEALRSA